MSHYPRDKAFSWWHFRGCIIAKPCSMVYLEIFELANTSRQALHLGDQCKALSLVSVWCLVWVLPSPYKSEGCLSFPLWLVGRSTKSFTLLFEMNRCWPSLNEVKEELNVLKTTCLWLLTDQCSNISKKICGFIANMMHCQNWPQC